MLPTRGAPVSNDGGRVRRAIGKWKGVIVSENNDIRWINVSGEEVDIRSKNLRTFFDVFHLLEAKSLPLSFARFHSLSEAGTIMLAPGVCCLTINGLGGEADVAGKADDDEAMRLDARDAALPSELRPLTCQVLPDVGGARTREVFPDFVVVRSVDLGAGHLPILRLDVDVGKVGRGMRRGGSGGARLRG